MAVLDPNTSASNPDTRRRVLEAAGEIFARVGFREATIREICTKANANVAAVNYHFGDKQGLYQEVFRFARVCSLETYPVAPDVLSQLPPDEALAEYVRTFLARIFDRGRHAWFSRLIAREMAEPTGVLDEMVQEHIRPKMAALAQIIGRLLERPALDPIVMRCVASVIGQCLHYFHSRPVLERLFPHMRFEPGELEAIARHITAFSLAGIDAAPAVPLSAADAMMWSTA
ncbi:MAG: CerR family C-terminal domain-containing protein [Phycisphaeraceae bacterium]|nr:CerR family C-terminal domain-containing protein [Phycisphaeraceae bacterium]